MISSRVVPSLRSSATTVGLSLLSSSHSLSSLSSSSSSSSSLISSSSSSASSSSSSFSLSPSPYFITRRFLQYVSPYWNSVLKPAAVPPPFSPITDLKAYLRNQDAVGKYAARRLRSVRGQIPCVVMKKGNSHEKLFVSVPMRAMESEIQKAFPFNRVFKLLLHEGPAAVAPKNRGYGPHPPRSTPITDPLPPPKEPTSSIFVIPSVVDRHPLTNALINVLFVEFKPNTRNRIKVPIRYLGAEDGPAAKKGANVSLHTEVIDFWWMGDENIPHALTVDLSQAKLGLTVRLRDLQLPQNLIPYYPTRDYVLATVRGATIYEDDDEEEAKEAAAATPAAGAAGDKAAGDKAAAGSDAAADKKK